MDTTAAAELAVAMAGPGVDGVAFWAGAAADTDPWSEDDTTTTTTSSADTSCRAEWSRNAHLRPHPHRRPALHHPKRPPSSLDLPPKRSCTEVGSARTRTPGDSDHHHHHHHAFTGRGTHGDSVPSAYGGKASHGDLDPPPGPGSQGFDGGNGDLNTPGSHRHGGRGSSEDTGQSGSQGYGGRPADSDHPVNDSVFNHNSYGTPQEDYDNGSGFQGHRMNGYGSGLQKQGSMKGSNSFSGEVGSVVESSNLTSSAGGVSSAVSSATKGKGTGSIFFKTKLCCKFRAGICPYNSNCNFAHGMEELRKPPPGWEEIVAAQEAERASRGSRESQVQVVIETTGSGGSGDTQRFHKTPRPCRKYYTEDGCPYGDRCIFMHDDQVSQSRALRESNAISLGPTNGTSNGAGNGGNGSERPSNWKTRVCNKWETTGHCPFGQKCHFVHGGSDGHALASNTRPGVVASVQFQKQGSKLLPKWKGPSDEISTIYGDWIEEDEWDNPPTNVILEGVQKTSKANKVMDPKSEHVLHPQQSYIQSGNLLGISVQKERKEMISLNGSSSAVEDGWDGEL